MSRSRQRLAGALIAIVLVAGCGEEEMSSPEPTGSGGFDSARAFEDVRMQEEVAAGYQATIAERQPHIAPLANLRWSPVNPSTTGNVVPWSASL